MTHYIDEEAQDLDAIDGIMDTVEGEELEIPECAINDKGPSKRALGEAEALLQEALGMTVEEVAQVAQTKNDETKLMSSRDRQQYLSELQALQSEKKYMVPDDYKEAMQRLRENYGLAQPTNSLATASPEM